jgi:hypothetical protein
MKSTKCSAFPNTVQENELPYAKNVLNTYQHPNISPNSGPRLATVI